MSFFDSPVGRCEVVREMVLLDETQAQCACEHGCPRGIVCPLKGYFAEQSGVSDPSSLPKSPPARKRRNKASGVRAIAPRVSQPSKAFVFAQKAPLPERKVA